MRPTLIGLLVASLSLAHACHPGHVGAANCPTPPAPPFPPVVSIQPPPSPQPSLPPRYPPTPPPPPPPLFAELRLVVVSSMASFGTGAQLLMHGKTSPQALEVLLRSADKQLSEAINAAVRQDATFK